MKINLRRTGAGCVVVALLASCAGGSIDADIDSDLGVGTPLATPLPPLLVERTIGTAVMSTSTCADAAGCEYDWDRYTAPPSTGGTSYLRATTTEPSYTDTTIAADEPQYYTVIHRGLSSSSTPSEPSPALVVGPYTTGSGDGRRPPTPTITATQIPGNPNMLRVTRTAGANPDDIPITHTQIFYGTSSSATDAQSALTDVGGETTQIDIPVTSAPYWVRCRDYNPDGDPEKYSASSPTFGPISPASGTPSNLLYSRSGDNPLPLVMPPGGYSAMGEILEQGAVPTGFTPLTRGALNLQLSNRQARKGTYSYRAYVNGASAIAQNRERSEMRVFPSESGGVVAHDYPQRRFYGWSMYLEPPWANQQRNELLGQFHVNPDADDTHKNPAASFHIVGTVKATASTPAGSLTFLHRGEGQAWRTFNLGIPPKGVWIDIVVDARWAIAATGPDSGWLRVYTRYDRTGPLVLRYEYRGITSYDDYYGPYIKLGIYNFDWMSTAPPLETGNPVTYREAFFDGPYIGDANSSVAAVDPENQ